MKLSNISILEPFRVRVVLIENSLDELIHRPWATVNIHSIRIIQRANLLQYLLGDIPCVAFPILIPFVNNVAKLKSGYKFLQFFSQHYILFFLISEQ